MSIHSLLSLAVKDRNLAPFVRRNKYLGWLHNAVFLIKWQLMKNRCGAVRTFCLMSIDDELLLKSFGSLQVFL